MSNLSIVYWKWQNSNNSVFSSTTFDGSSISVADLKREIATHDGLQSHSNLRLASLTGLEFKDRTMIHSNSSFIVRSVKPDTSDHNEITVVVRGICGTFCVNMSRSDSVETLQQFIYDRTKMSVNTQRLTYNRKQLQFNKNRSLTECGIESGCVIDLSLSHSAMVDIVADDSVIQIPFDKKTTVDHVINSIYNDYPQYRPNSNLDIDLLFGEKKLDRNVLISTVPTTKKTRIGIKYSDNLSLRNILQNIRIEIWVAASANTHGLKRDGDYKMLFGESVRWDHYLKSSGAWNESVHQLAMDLFFHCKLPSMWKQLPSVYHSTDCYPVKMTLTTRRFKELIPIYSDCFVEQCDNDNSYPIVSKTLETFWERHRYKNIRNLKIYRQCRPETLIVQFTLPNRSAAFNVNNTRYHFYWDSRLANAYNRPQLYRMSDNRKQICIHSCDSPPMDKEMTLKTLVDSIFAEEKRTDQQSITVANDKSIDPNTDLWFLTHSDRPFLEISLQSKPNLSGDELAIRPLISKDSSGGNCSICFDPLTAIGLSVVDEKEECDEKTQCDEDTDNDGDADADETCECETGYARLSHCTHMFHWACIRTYLRHRRDNRCPLCRAQFTVVQSRPYAGALKIHKVSHIMADHRWRQLYPPPSNNNDDLNDWLSDSPPDWLSGFPMRRRLTDVVQMSQSTVNCDGCDRGVHLVESNSYINCAHCFRFYHNQCFNVDDFIQCAHCSVLIHRNCVGNATDWNQTGNGQWQHTHA